ncbi:double-strand-break repair protein rad21 homolog isoform X2 [Tubulanus polymorphus]|uniref:double-strand-break repair protein rad21 homolog isoform X2 n=1 Tax=Tubulanus polymorphus TaxID=672921 RepID=UPI003DA47CAA
MFYAHFVLSKKGPLARIWLAAHWDKKLTKAHVFETNISSSVEAILEPKVKMALRTSGHLLLGVVRIYSRKAKYLLADCNEAFVKIKMAFRPGVVDLPEENREAAVAAITLPETFHDFDTTMADLNDIDVQAQFTVNQSRPEEITMREEIGNIPIVGDEGFGDIGFDDKEIMRDAGNMEESLYRAADRSTTHLLNATDKSHDASVSTHRDPSTEKPMDVDAVFNAPMRNDAFEQVMGDGLLAPPSPPAGCDDDDDDDNNGDFGGDVDHDLFGDADFNMGAGGLFEEPVAEVSMAQDVSGLPPLAEKEVAKELQMEVPDMNMPGTSAAAAAAAAAISQPVIPNLETTQQQQQTLLGEQTTLVQNEDEAFALEPLDITAIGTERKTKRKRKLIVDDQKGIPSETMKIQLSDTSDIVTTLDLAPPTKKLMHWKETGGVEKLFALPGRALCSKFLPKVFQRNLTTRPMAEEEDDDDKLDLDQPEQERGEIKRITRRRKNHYPQQQQQQQTPDQSLLAPPPSVGVDVNRFDVTADYSLHPPPSVQQQPDPIDSDIPLPVLPTLEDTLPQMEPPSNIDISVPQMLDDDPTGVHPTELQQLEQLHEQQQQQQQRQLDDDEDLPNDDIFSSEFQEGLIDIDGQGQLLSTDEMAAIAATEEYAEKRLSKRTHVILNMLQTKLRDRDSMTFREFTHSDNRKKAASKFYTFLVLKKQENVCLHQSEPFGDITLSRGPNFDVLC